MTDPSSQAWALSGLVRALAAAGEHDRAEQIARSITHPNMQSQALADLACEAEPVKARSMIADALAVGRWTISLSALARVDLVALSVFADNYAPLKARTHSVSE
jgi:hypothetical protein